MKRYCALLLAMCLVFSMSGCGNVDSTPKPESTTPTIREITIENGIPNSDEYERFIVSLTNDNLADYLCYSLYNYYNAFGEVEGCVPLFKSLPYDNGWILAEVNDFAIICSFDIYTADNQLHDKIFGEELVENDLFGFPNFYYDGNCENYRIENFVIEKVKGTLTYISNTILDTYSIDNDARVVTALGETYKFNVRTKDCLF